MAESIGGLTMDCQVTRYWSAWLQAATEGCSSSSGHPAILNSPPPNGLPLPSNRRPNISMLELVTSQVTRYSLRARLYATEGKSRFSHPLELVKPSTGGTPL